jgi:hypothetical protein
MMEPIDQSGGELRISDAPVIRVRGLALWGAVVVVPEDPA